MSKKQFKIKNNQTGLYWIGYGSNFDEKGAVFTSYEDAGRGIATQLSLRHNSLIPCLPHLEIVEYEVVVTEKQSHVAKDCLLSYRFTMKMREKHGYDFSAAYSKIAKLQKKDPEKIFKYAIKVNYENFAEFRATMKDLGYSSRHYRKVDEWLFTESPDVVVRAKLIAYSDKIVNLETEMIDFSETESYYKEAE